MTSSPTPAVLPDARALSRQLAYAFCGKLKQSQKADVSERLGIKLDYSLTALERDKRFLRAVVDAGAVGILQAAVSPFLPDEFATPPASDAAVPAGEGKAWREAVIDGLIVAHIYNEKHDTDPRKALHDLICWEVDVALDPRVSQRAADLAAPKAASDTGAGLREAAQFLSDRLDELEWMDDDLEATCRDYMGHVDPAHDRLKSALATDATDGATGGGEARESDGTAFGEVQCHCSEDDGIPDVGVSLGLGDGKALWIGETLLRDGANCGMVFHDGSKRIVAPFPDGTDWQEAADILRHHVGPALTAATTPDAAASEAAVPAGEALGPLWRKVQQVQSDAMRHDWSVEDYRAGMAATLGIAAAPKVASDTGAGKLGQLRHVARMVVEASDLCGFSGPLGDAARAALATPTDATGGGEAVAWCSPGQLANLMDVDADGGVYLPIRKTKRSNFTMPLFATTPGGDLLEQAARYRHVKRGTVYTVVGKAELQTVSGALVDGSALVVYRGEDGKLWAREEGEFHDGRFEPLKPAGDGGEA